MADESSASQSNRTRTYNIITAIILAVTLVVCLVVVYMGVVYGREARARSADAEPMLISDAQEATRTIAAPTANPTQPDDAASEVTETAAPTAAATSTTRPTATRTAEPSSTPTATEGASETPEPTETTGSTAAAGATSTEESEDEGEAAETATATATSSPFDYVLRDGEVEFTSNFANTAGCDWMGVAGEVFDADGEPVTGIYVHVTGGNVDMRVKSGDYPLYGESGWEVYLNNQPREGTYTVQLETEAGEPLSDEITVETRDSCDANLALLVFDGTE